MNCAIIQKLQKTAGRTFDLLGFGECSHDLVYRLPVQLAEPLPDKTSALAHEVLGGGQIATACVAAARLGRRARFAGVIGADGAGRALVEGLVAEGVDASLVCCCPGVPTRTAVILCDRAGERAVIEWRSPKLLPPTDLLRPEDIAAARVLHVDLGFPEATLAAAAKAQTLGALVSVDLDQVTPGAKSLLEKTDLCVVSARFPAQLTGCADELRAARLLSDYTPGVVVVTRGAQGCLLVCDGDTRKLPAFEPPALVDTTACGDTFHAAFVCALLDAVDGGDTACAAAVFAEAARFASGAAALKCRDVGRRGCPRLAEVLSFLSHAPA